MLDVHPPHHAAHSWRDFFIHIATIVVGLLIAVGLEQTVEALHHRHQAAELREALHIESEQITRDSEITANGTNDELIWVRNRIKQVQATVWEHQRLSEPPVLKTADFDFPDDPIWRSAKAAGITELLHQDELNAYSEVELVMAHVQATYDEWRLVQRRRIEFEREFPLLPDGTSNFSPASPQDMRTYLGLLTAESEVCLKFYEWNRAAMGVESSINKGHLRLPEIFDSERLFFKNDPS